MRAAAVSALANFGAVCESLRPRILVLLRRALSDNDDEVSFARLGELGRLAKETQGDIHGPHRLAAF